MYIDETPLVLEYLGYTAFTDFEFYGADNSVVWLSTDPQPTEQDVLDNAKPWSAAAKTEEIYREQEIRSETVYGEPVSRNFFAWIEEFYTDILLPSARNNITEANTPITFGLKALRDNRNTLLNGLQNAVDDPAQTYEDILAFDVAGWSGWDVARP